MRVCDICKKEEVLEQYIIPVIQDYYAESHGVKLAAFHKIQPKTIDLCPDCAAQVAMIFENLT